MFKLISIVLLTLLLTLPSASSVYSAEANCVLGDEKEFRESVSALNPAFVVAKPIALQKALALINKNRASAGKHIIEADHMIGGVFVNPAKNALMMGYAFFKDGCLVPGAVGAMPAAVFAGFITEAGIDFEKDFTEERSS